MIDNFTDGIRLIILDLSGVTFLDVVGVKALRRVCNHQIVSCINNPCCLFRRV
jgi:anti-anti-sigma regulatory factor